jgi:predicted deacylase
MMVFVLGIQFLPSLARSAQKAPPTQVPPFAPRLLALETSLPPQPTRTAVPLTFTTVPKMTVTAAQPGFTTTPFELLHEQRADVIGYSVEGRPLNVYSFGNGPHQRMIVANLHGGDEWNTLTLANQLIRYLNQDSSVIPEDVTLYILPTLNPDGEARAHNKYGRLNHNGVDLNRNFPINWLADWELAGCWNYLPTSGGTGPGSEAETQALIGFISNHNIEVLISYHSAALGIFPGGDPRDENSVRLAEAIAEVSTYRYPPLDTGCIYSGTLPDFAVSKGIAAVDIELTNHIETDFDQNLNILQVLLDWAE